MSEARAFRGVWIPAELWLSRELSLQEKVMLVEIGSLSVDPDRGCYKSNKAFAEFFGITKGRVSQIIAALSDKGYIRISYRRDGNRIVERNIFLSGSVGEPRYLENKPGCLENSPTPSENIKGGYLENAEESNTYKSNTVRVIQEGENSPSPEPRAEKPKSKIPPCPYQALVDLYHEVLPQLPKILELNSERRGLLKARWTEHPDLNWWREYFEWVGQSKFLTGQTDPRPGKPPFFANLEWITRPRNFVNIIEGKYHREAV
ncbi:helix-turn-helix domain-containing protein [Microbulbifer thermotolerans]|uniref:Helix-turn-helix domain-containing protein n=1 Tax=Microbulbifer thermotolerans TaxID=252514 RepID=A0AB35HZL8_MICTH|nr:helix-turn-helix domain-containing protein [Microbulbifer thermotolerans]MCX2780402.1 helix-turn-helix domain-containing protein [Microbulbifer thermotolerans]MCX2802236.1 helix-turn-helix domain-containing protein [Microbulbifer thermotolerans]MCX2805926.1 helix-turn-helix domain-containing protein [Microbulbifer thermotolerans]